MFHGRLELHFDLRLDWRHYSVSRPFATMRLFEQVDVKTQEALMVCIEKQNLPVLCFWTDHFVLPILTNNIRPIVNFRNCFIYITIYQNEHIVKHISPFFIFRYLVEFISKSGGFRNLKNIDLNRHYATNAYTGLTLTKSVTVKFDFIAPKHCSDDDVQTKCAVTTDTHLTVNEDITRVFYSLHNR